jgi:hypothetical protein
MGFVMETFDGRFLDRAVQPLDMARRPRMVRFGQPVLDPIRLPDHVEAHWPGIDGVPVQGLLGELGAVVWENRVDLIRHGFEQVLQELLGGLSVRLCNELSDGELGGPVDTDEQLELALGCLRVRNIDADEADGVARELLAFWLGAFDFRQAGNAVPLQTPMQC